MDAAFNPIANFVGAGTPWSDQAPHGAMAHTTGGKLTLPMSIGSEGAGKSELQQVGGGGLNPHAKPFQFSTAAPSFQPASAVPMMDDQLALMHSTGAPPMPFQTPYIEGGGVVSYPSANLLYTQGGLVMPGAYATPHSDVAVALDELQCIQQYQYQAKMLPPPLPLAKHNKIWRHNMCEIEEDEEGGADHPSHNNSSPPTEEGDDISEYSFMSENEEDKAQRLRAYKDTMNRWFRVIQVLEEKPEIVNRIRWRPCKSYEEVYKQCISGLQSSKSPENENSPNSARSMANEGVDEEVVLRAWSDECMRWWQECGKKKTRRARKKKPEETAAGVFQQQPLPAVPPPMEHQVAHELYVRPAEVEHLLGQHHAAGIIPEAMHHHRSFSSMSELQFDDASLNDDVSEAMATELLLQFED